MCHMRKWSELMPSKRSIFWCKVAIKICKARGEITEIEYACETIKSSTLASPPSKGSHTYRGVTHKLLKDNKIWVACISIFKHRCGKRIRRHLQPYQQMLTCENIWTIRHRITLHSTRITLIKSYHNNKSRNLEKSVTRIIRNYHSKYCQWQSKSSLIIQNKQTQLIKQRNKHWNR